MEQSKWTTDDGVKMAWLGAGLCYAANRFVMPFILSAGIALLVVGVVVVLLGCYLWATKKNRHWAFMFWGLLAPIGFLGIALLKNRAPKAPESATKG